ncbi:Tn5253 hypothetical protein [Streptococcus pneumoniae]|nr:Tn5253 hypothetical protein [Streptococcus pneumoniae]
MAERFWENLSIILAERNISWIELTRKMFAGEFHYPSELNRLYQKIRVFVLYGQGYRAEGKEGILTTQVTVKAYDEDKKPINFANLLDSLIVSEYQMEPNLWEVSHD